METKESRISLPLMGAGLIEAPRWQGLSAAHPLPPLHFTDAEPLAPQGVYNLAEPEMPLSVPLVDSSMERDRKQRMSRVR